MKNDKPWTRVPMALGPMELSALFVLWQWHNNLRFPFSMEKRSWGSLRKLKRYGYVERDKEGSWKITQRGVYRLECPMSLVPVGDASFDE